MARSAVITRLVLTALLAGSTVAQAEFIVPQRWWGDLEYSYRQARYTNSYSTTSNMVSGRLNTDAYLWQPWFATLSASLALSEDRSSSTSGTGTATTSHITTGEASMALLPLSRFPFTARYAVSDSRVDSSAANDNPLLAQSTARQFSRNQLQLSQGYYGDLYRLNFRYNNDEAQSDLGERYLQEGYGVDYSWRGLKQNLNANALFQTQSNNQSSNDSDNTVVSVNHSYYPSSQTNLDTVASHVKVDNFYTTTLTGVTQQVTSNIDQASTSLGWRSSSRPLRINGGVRVHQMDYLLNDGTTSTTMQNEGFNSSLGAGYQFSDRLSGSVNGQYNALRSDSSEVRSHSEMAALYYSSERRTLRQFDYGWNSGLAATHQQSGASKAESTTLSLGHSASRSWTLEDRSALRLSLGQDLAEGYTHSSGPVAIGYSPGLVGETRRLGHSLSLGWMGSDPAGSSMAQLTLSDSRGIVGDESSSQMVNAQLSRSQLLDNRSSLNGNLSWQAWHYTLPPTPDYGVGTTTTASANYQYVRPFTLQRVTFTSQLTLTDSQPALGAGVQESYWDNRFTHEIGMLRSSLGLTFRNHMGIESMMLLLSVKRLF